MRALDDSDYKGVVIVKGIVSTGVNEGKYFTSLPWFRRQVKEILGFEPYPGTLNLLLKDSDYRRLTDLFNKSLGYRVFPENGYFPGRLYKAIIMSSMLVAIIKPCVPNYPKNLLEIIAPICLRKFFNLRDGDEVEVKIFFK
ncbi:MAG: DUF120 domain-containing protein [Candidatus Bathyarchaeia archaeon]